MTRSTTFLGGGAAFHRCFQKAAIPVHSQKLRTCLGKKYHLEWYDFLMRPARTIHHVVLPKN
jgi:hypothetical protein